MAMDKDTSMIDWLVKKGMDTDCMEIKYLQARKLLSGKVFLHFGHSHSCVFCLCGPLFLPLFPFGPLAFSMPRYRCSHRSTGYYVMSLHRGQDLWC